MHYIKLHFTYFTYLLMSWRPSVADYSSGMHYASNRLWHKQWMAA